MPLKLDSYLTYHLRIYCTFRKVIRFKQLTLYQELIAWPVEIGLKNMHAEPLEFHSQAK